MASKSRTKTASKAKTKAVVKAKAKPAAKRSSLRLNPPKKTTFWASVIIGAVGIVTYVFHVAITHLDFLPAVEPISTKWFSPAAFLLLVVAFVLQLLGLLVKGF